MSDNVVRTDEVVLYGYRFPIVGTVRKTAVNPFPPKIVTGDYSRDSRVLDSSWISSKWNGGLGILYGQFPRDQERFWWANGVDTSHKFLTLGPLITKVHTTGPADLIIDYNGDTFFVVDGAAKRWNGTAIVSTSPSQTITGTLAGGVVFDDSLLIFTSSNIYKWNGSSWSSWAVGSNACVVWDDKVWRIDQNNNMYWSIGPNYSSGDWTAAGKLRVPPGYCKQLIVYFDLTGEEAIHAVTRAGLYAYDFASQRFYRTPLTYPVSDGGATIADVFRGELRVPDKATIYNWNGSTITNVGPARDDGLPSELFGSIRQVVGGHAYCFAVLNSLPSGGEPPVNEVRVSDPLALDPMGQTTSVGAVLYSPGVSWHVLYSGSAGTQMGYAYVTTSSVDGKYRLWFSDGNGVYTVELSTELHNPLQNPTQTFSQQGYLETYWNDMGWPEMDKVALSLDVETAGCSSTEKIRIWIDFDERGQYEQVCEITTNGASSFRLGSDSGVPFRSARLRFELERGSDNTKTPVLKSAALVYVRRPDIVWGWQLELNLTRDWDGVTKSELMRRFVEIVERKEVGQFTYRDERDEERSARVVFTQVNGAERGGAEDEGRFTVFLASVGEL
jgi:hypothetical protein